MSEKTGVKYKIWLKGIYQCIHKWLTPCIKQGSTHCNINFIRTLIHLIPLHILNCFSISRHFKSYYSCSNISDTALSDTMKCNVENVQNLYRSTDHGIYFHEMPRQGSNRYLGSLSSTVSQPPPLHFQLILLSIIPYVNLIMFRSFYDYPPSCKFWPTFPIFSNHDKWWSANLPFTDKQAHHFSANVDVYW